MGKEKSKLIIGISSRALFDLDESHEIYKKEGLKSYADYQIDNENETLAPGQAFNLVQKILKINDLYEKSDRVEVILLSRNTSDTGLRIRNSIEDHNLNISRAAFCGGESPHRYVKDFGVHLFFQAA
jgi:5''-nucleotidase.